MYERYELNNAILHRRHLPHNTFPLVAGLCRMTQLLKYCEASPQTAGGKGLRRAMDELLQGELGDEFGGEFTCG